MPAALLPHFVRARVVILPLAWALAACHTLPPNEAAEGRLYGEVYSDIVRYHIDATSPDRLAMMSLAALPEIDPSLSVSESSGVVHLRSSAGEYEFPAPPADDSKRWGNLAGSAVAAARRASPAFAALAPDRADERLLDAALGRLDRYSRYVGPEIAHERRAERDGYVGLGVTLDIAPPLVRIASVLPDTPAAAAGLKAADRIVKVDGTALATLSADRIRARLDGPKDSVVALEIARAGTQEDLTVVMRRALIVADSVALEEGNGVAVLRVKGFNQQTASSAARLLGKAHRDLGAGLLGIVLDLRGNPGGLLEQSVDLASLFLDSGLVSSTAGRVPDSLQAFRVDAHAPVERLPLAVLVNGDSASASEIVAAALQDAGRAVVIGTATFGKGTVQTVFRTGNGGELTVTWAELLSPRGYRLNHHGVVPTLCTSGLSQAPEAWLELAAAPGPLAAPREALDESGWRELRERCPPRREASALDLEIAQRLLAQPALYRAAILPSPAHSVGEGGASAKGSGG